MTGSARFQPRHNSDGRARSAVDRASPIGFGFTGSGLECGSETAVHRDDQQRPNHGGRRRGPNAWQRHHLRGKGRDRESGAIRGRSPQGQERARNGAAETDLATALKQTRDTAGKGLSALPISHVGRARCSVASRFLIGFLIGFPWGGLPSEMRRARAARPALLADAGISGSRWSAVQSRPRLFPDLG